MDYAIKLIRAISPAIVIVAVAAFLLGALYETCFAYTEIYDQQQLTNSNNIPTAIGLTNHYYHVQQSFTPSATTTNLTAFETYGHYHAGKCNGAYPNIEIALCDGETPGSINDLSGQTNYQWPCNGGSFLFQSLSNNITTLFGTTGSYVKFSWGNPYSLTPNHKYYMDFRWYEPSSNDSCLSMAYAATEHYTDGRMFGGTSDLVFRTSKYSDWQPASSTGDVHVWDLDDLETLKATTSPMIVTPDYNVCYYDNGEPCEIEVYWNEAADERDTILMLSKYIFNGEAINYMDVHTITDADDRHTRLSYTPKETMATTVPICITEVWNDNGDTQYREDCTPKVHWKSQATLDTAYATLFGRAQCNCTETTGFLECGGRKIACFLFVPDATSTLEFEKARQNLLSGFPFGTWTAVEREVISAQMRDNSPLDFPIYFFGYPVAATSTYMGSLDIVQLRDTLDDYGWNYIYYIFKWGIWIGFFGLILWRLWTIITGTDMSIDTSGEQAYSTPVKQLTDTRVKQKGNFLTGYRAVKQSQTYVNTKVGRVNLSKWK